MNYQTITKDNQDIKPDQGLMNPQGVISQPPDMNQSNVAHCPPGLNYLMSVNQLLVKQTVEAFEALSGFETNNRYKVLNSMGQEVYKAAEVNDCCTLNCCGKNRPFDMKIFDNMGMEVMRFERPLRCNANCFPFCCCGLEIRAYAPPGNYIGKAIQRCSPCIGPRFEILDEQDHAQLRVKGPCCSFVKCCNVHYKMFPMDSDVQIGVITKQWSGIIKEGFTDADNFGVAFPMDLEVRMKALSLALCILIDFMYYEDSGTKRMSSE